ncbi:uncharacterized protein LOC110845120 [Folsomia candida]|uniref:Uncharacterized protein n=1 Tax=Folsomia candida TaxID=158441 RepID=A0A226EMN2_FOLCA|nr:uncharacterized protein LOC110845120 [Folsomia candida]OXA58933.1 hypothetical protein Fcan01_05499 [Folsomia candida]
MKAFLAISVVAVAIVATLAFPSPNIDASSPGDAGAARVARQQGTAAQGYLGGVTDAGDAAPPGDPRWKDPAYWEKNHEKQWGGFENAMEKWQNWAADSNSGNYKLANNKVGAFDNGEFNAEKASEEFFGPDHVRNDWKFGNYTTNAGFGVGAAIQTAPGSGDKSADGKGGFWAKLHCRLHSSLFLQKKHLRLPVPCSLIL